ncbi:Arm DNA-binding domain-containing protein [Nodosilinea sp. PGN35]|uniref:site-specific integrase n=1 Tax=Nodosilinea sp. PGN35 TaxID=3020489 RepID=UPI0023B2BA25|nr:site-specific integrase [Nodosilinea sp. TSF1-S3]MDF0368450.1 DUF3596 domain-containing protein [Nodosilinea sp. TSF1-S3]
MQATQRNPKSIKGSVQIKVSNARLQLVFTYARKRRYVSTGYPDTPKYRRVAERKAAIIEEDIEKDRFDPTLNKYRSQPKYIQPKESIDLKPSLVDLWDGFIEFKRPQCSPSTMYKQYRTFTNYLHALPTHDLSQGREIIEHCLKTIPPKSCKRFIIRLSACCMWAMKAGLITENPFGGIASDIKIPKSQKSEDDDIYPFSVEERDAILEAFQTDIMCSKFSQVKHSYYYPFLFFLFKTGCRPSEAIALQWKHIDKDFSQIRFVQAVVESEEGRVCKTGLKTQERRVFPCNQSLREFLQEIKPCSCDRESLLFPSPRTGTWINTGNFQERIWKSVLNKVGIEYRKPYQTRHTFITLALDHGLEGV